MVFSGSVRERRGKEPAQGLYSRKQLGLNTCKEDYKRRNEMKETESSEMKPWRWLMHGGDGERGNTRLVG